MCGFGSFFNFFAGQTLIYQYAKTSETELKWEKLTIDGKSIFQCDFTLKHYDFVNLKYINAETANIDRYQQSLEEEETTEGPKLPFLRWLINNMALNSDSVLIKLSNYVFYHYEMAVNVIKFLKRKYPKCQIIMTSHNTNLMTNRLMRPDCLFILSGFGTLTSLGNATGRELREGHNLEKMYISGEFERYE